MLLDQADRLEISLQHIALQKLLYFSHGDHLVRFGAPLVRGEFEAWKFGPVHPVAYNAFKICGAVPIGPRRATILDLSARIERFAPVPADPRAVDVIERVLDRLGHLPAVRLVELSHAPNGPWRRVVDKARTQGSLGLKISDSLIAERFLLHIPVSAGPPLGDLSEDYPLTA